MPYRQRTSPGKHAYAQQMRANPTPAEAKLWHRLRQRELHGGLKFRRQEVILGFIVDFYCPTAAVAIEVDGSIHESNVQYLRDRARDSALAGRGIRTLRFTNADVADDFERVIARIVNICQSRKIVSRKGGRLQVAQAFASGLDNRRRVPAGGINRSRDGAGPRRDCEEGRGNVTGRNDGATT